MVIVIAVIAILAAVLIPTFGNVIEKANESAALQEARNIYTEYLADYNYVEEDSEPLTDGYVITSKGVYVKIEDGKATEIIESSETTGLDQIEAPAEEVTPTQPTTHQFVDENEDEKCDTCEEAENHANHAQG